MINAQLICFVHGVGGLIPPVVCIPSRWLSSEKIVHRTGFISIYEHE